MVTTNICPKAPVFEHAPKRSVTRCAKGNPSDAFLRYRASVATIYVGRAAQEVVESKAPKGLTLEESIQVLRNTPHKAYIRPPEVLAAFEHLLQRIEQQHEDDEELMRDASEEHDKYIYG